MFKQKLFLKITLSVFALAILILCIIGVKKSFAPKYDGTIIIEVIDLNGDTIKEKSINFSEGDLLETLIESNFDNVTFNSGMLMSIENYVTPTDWSTFICVYVDDVMSEVGISDIKFYDGCKISLIITELYF